MRQAYDYWQDQPGSLIRHTDEPRAIEASVASGRGETRAREQRIHSTRASDPTATQAAKPECANGEIRHRRKGVWFRARRHARLRPQRTKREGRHAQGARYASTPWTEVRRMQHRRAPVRRPLKGTPTLSQNPRIRLPTLRKRRRTASRLSERDGRNNAGREAPNGPAVQPAAHETTNRNSLDPSPRRIPRCSEAARAASGCTDCCPLGNGPTLPLTDATRTGQGFPALGCSAPAESHRHSLHRTQLRTPKRND